MSQIDKEIAESPLEHNPKHLVGAQVAAWAWAGICLVLLSWWGISSSTCWAPRRWWDGLQERAEELRADYRNRRCSARGRAHLGKQGDRWQSGGMAPAHQRRGRGATLREAAAGSRRVAVGEHWPGSRIGVPSASQGHRVLEVEG